MKSKQSKSGLICMIITVSVLMGIEIVDAQVTPTNQWVDFYSSNTTALNGELIAVGAVVDAYDPDGIHCGTYAVDTEGSYGFLHVYRDDAETTEDEGAVEGDKITFKIYDEPANVAGPDDNTWTANGDAWKVDLVATVGLVEEELMPDKYALHQNYPNPFNPTTTIEFSMPKSELVILIVFDFLGREVETLLYKEMDAGYHIIQWNATNVPSGIYFVKMQSGNFSQVKKVMVLR